MAWRSRRIVSVLVSTAALLGLGSSPRVRDRADDGFGLSLGGILSGMD